jgi:DNA topoisomerase-1
LVYKTKAKNTQEGHEAIRPTNIATKIAGGDDDQKRLYTMIWKRTIASQMNNAKVARRSAEFTAGEFVLSAAGSRQLFDGFRKIWDYSKSEDKYLPERKQGDVVSVEKLDSIEKETKPPPRFTEASFIKELEKTGIGRPSTFSTIPETLKARDYIELNQSKSIVVTALGLCVLKFLIQVDFCFIDLSFTAKMEEVLDEIANNNGDKLAELTKFWDQLKEDLKQVELVKVANSKTDFKCPKCEKELVKKHSRFGPFYGCGGYPECKYTAQVGKNQEPVEKVKKEKKEIILSEHDCPKCNEKMVLRKSKFGEFHGCSKYPKCKGILDKDGKVPEPKKRRYKKKKK